MSGSTDASTIAERTKLEAELREAREGLDDTYYGHGMDSMSNALDDEMSAYEKSTNNYLKSLRESIKDTKLLVEDTLINVLANADTVMSKITELSGTYGFTLEPNLINPWINASNQANDFKDNANTYLQSLINEDGIITTFGSEDNKAKLSGLFGVGSGAASQFAIDVGTHMSTVERTVNSYTSLDMQKYLGNKLKAPWDDAANDEQSGPKVFSKTAKQLMDGVVDHATYNYKEQLKKELDYPWNNADAYTSWGDGIKGVLDGVISKAKEAATAITNVNNSNPPNYEGNGGGDKIPTSTPKSGGSGPYSGAYNADVYALQEVLTTIFKQDVGTKGYWGPKTEAALINAQKAINSYLKTTSCNTDGKFTKTTRDLMVRYIEKKIEAQKQQGNGSSMNGQYIQYYTTLKNNLPSYFAKGTLGTTKDQWAITDESWIGEEITLAAGKNGQLQYLKKGSAVMPADISANLVEWGKMNPNMMSFGDMSGGIQMMSNYVSKPEVNLSFDSLVHVDHCDEGTLKDLEKMVDTKINQFSKQMNYAIKKFK